MEFIEHSVAWCRGEIFEGRMLALFGAVVVGVAVVFWRYGSTPSARAIVVPVITILGLAVFLWKPTPLGRTIGLATVLLGLAVLFLDHFSEERADGYHTQIIREVERRGAEQPSP